MNGIQHSPCSASNGRKKKREVGAKQHLSVFAAVEGVVSWLTHSFYAIPSSGKEEKDISAEWNRGSCVRAKRVQLYRRLGAGLAFL